MRFIAIKYFNRLTALRITNQNLAFSFFVWDRYTPHLLKLYKQKQPGTIRQVRIMNELFNNTVLYIVAEPHKACFPCPKTQQDEKDVQATRKAVLFGLALYLKEDASDIFKSCKVCTIFIHSFIHNSFRPLSL